MSSTKRRKVDQDTASNASGTGRGSGNAGSVSGSAAAAASAAASSRRGGGGPGSRGGHSAATASRAAAAAAAATTGPGGASSSTSGGATGVGGNSHASGGGGGGPGSAGLNPADAPYVPVLPLSALPVSALSKYALHFGLIPPEPLTMAQATFPTPALPIELKLATTYTAPTIRSSRLNAGVNASNTDYRRNRSPYPVNAHHQTSPSTTANNNPAVSSSNGVGSRSERAGSSTPRFTQGNSNNNKSNSNDGTAATSTSSKLNGALSSSNPAQDGTSGSSTPASANANAKANAGDQPLSAATAASGSNSSEDVKIAEWTEPGEADAVELRGMTAYNGGEEQLRDRLGSLARTHWDKIPAMKEAETIVNFAYAIRMRSKVLKSAPLV